MLVLLLLVLACLASRVSPFETSALHRRLLQAGPTWIGVAGDSFTRLNYQLLVHSLLFFEKQAAVSPEFDPPKAAWNAHYHNHHAWCCARPTADGDDSCAHFVDTGNFNGSVSSLVRREFAKPGMLWCVTWVFAQQTSAWSDNKLTIRAELGAFRHARAFPLNTCFYKLSRLSDEGAYFDQADVLIVNGGLHQIQFQSAEQNAFEDGLRAWEETMVRGLQPGRRKKAPLQCFYLLTTSYAWWTEEKVRLFGMRDEAGATELLVKWWDMAKRFNKAIKATMRALRTKGLVARFTSFDLMALSGQDAGYNTLLLYTINRGNDPHFEADFYRDLAAWQSVVLVTGDSYRDD